MNRIKITLAFGVVAGVLQAKRLIAPARFATQVLAIWEEINHEKQQWSDFGHAYWQPAALEGAFGIARQT